MIAAVRFPATQDEMTAGKVQRRHHQSGYQLNFGAERPVESSGGLRKKQLTQTIEAKTKQL